MQLQFTLNLRILRSYLQHWISSNGAGSKSRGKLDGLAPAHQKLMEVEGSPSDGCQLVV